MEYTLYVTSINPQTSLTSYNIVPQITLEESDSMISKMIKNNRVMELIVKDSKNNLVKAWNSLFGYTTSNKELIS
jgi:hypothetical protein